MAELRLDGYINVILDPHAAQGIRKIGAKVAADVEAVTGTRSQINLPGAHVPCAILVAELGHDALADTLLANIPELASLKGRWESYGFYLAEHPIDGVGQGLVIIGSDRIGTIYGMFHLSELLGVTAWGFWGDVTPPWLGNVMLMEAPSHMRSEAENALRLTAADDAAQEPEDGTGGKDSDFHLIFVENGISREPSVKYRGFFINDEWPCFGNWTFSHYQGFTAQMYDHIFEYLLRMKGNYLWPAMWSSSFLLDGPGLASMELATEYGIYIGMSHHEPCMRSGAEFSIFKGENSPYGNEWSYVTNKEGLLRFWEDGLSRVKGQNIFPTIGMRGENDSKMLGEDSTVEENVRLLKEIITEQRKLIAKHINPDLKQVPQLFAIYKEVEDYYFGNASAAEKEPCPAGASEGLQGFEELEDVTLMFCEDNFNYMRALPQDYAVSGGERKGMSKVQEPSSETEAPGQTWKPHRGGYGMYYHVDYHGSPISYEWVNSTPITRIWEQMTQAWEYGIRDVWILNVGDVRFNEYPLGYFLALAYDFDTYGADPALCPENVPDGTGRALLSGNAPYWQSAYERTLAYPKEWITSIFGRYERKKTFPSRAWNDRFFPDEAIRAASGNPDAAEVPAETSSHVRSAAALVDDITWVLTESVRLGSLRRPEALNDRIYHTAHYAEGQRMLSRAEALEAKNEELLQALKGSPLEDAYFSLIYFPAAGIANLLKMHLYTGRNHLYSAQGKAIANRYGELLQACIERDEELARRMAAFRGGKWKGMELEKHIGFVNWNDEDFRYPVRHMLTLPQTPRLVVSRADRMESFTNQYFPTPLVIDDFRNVGTDCVTLQVANGGRGAVDWEIIKETRSCADVAGNTKPDGCFMITPSKGSTELQTEVEIRVLRDRIPAGETAELHFSVCAGREKVPVVLLAENRDFSDAPDGAFLMQDGVCVWDAADYCGQTSVAIPVRDGSENVSPVQTRASFGVLKDYGKYGSAVRVFPGTAVFDREDQEAGRAPSLTWEVWAGADELNCRLILHTSPSNPLVYGGQLRLGVSVNGGEVQTVCFTGEGYRGGDPSCEEWCRVALDQEHAASVPVRLIQGLNRITVFAGDAGIALERLTLVREGAELLPSYFGPEKSCRKGHAVS
ncbi:MAG: glycosyl hydrolase 115 family protein [Lachnospiraceae bacterium]|nr:glycosyl hydrolase 115 family protein [Lachnospiraceae bacterium]